MPPESLLSAFSYQQHYDDVTGKVSFIRLKPGQSHEFAVGWLALQEEDPFDAPASALKMIILYVRNGHEFGLRAWMGRVNVTFSERWQHPAPKPPDVDEE